MSDLAFLVGACQGLLPGPHRVGTIVRDADTGLLKLETRGSRRQTSALQHALRNIPAPDIPMEFSRNHCQRKKDLPRLILESADAIGVDGMKILRHLPPIILDSHARCVKGDPHRASPRLLAPFDDILGDELWNRCSHASSGHGTSAGFQPEFVARITSPFAGWVNARRFGFERCVAFALALGRHLATHNDTNITFVAEFYLPDLKEVGIDTISDVSDIPPAHNDIGFRGLPLVHTWVIENGEAVDVFGRRRTDWADSPLCRGNPKGVLCPVDETFLAQFTNHKELRVVEEILAHATSPPAGNKTPCAQPA